MRQTVAAVIPTYRPEPVALDRLTFDLVDRGIPVLIADDASPCTSDPALAAAAVGRGLPVIRHTRNVGIARSLNDGLRFADRLGARWLLTVDQDTTLAPDHVDRLLETAEVAAASLGPARVGAIAAGSIDDESGALPYPIVLRDGIQTTHEVIQTGTLWSVEALVSLGGFDERLGIDAVDAAACLALRRAGRHCVLAPEVRIEHRIGAGRQIRILGHNVMATGHAPARRATIVRNRLRLLPTELAQSPVHGLRTLRRLIVSSLLSVTIEDDRRAKAQAVAVGAVSSLKPLERGPAPVRTKQE